MRLGVFCFGLYNDRMLQKLLTVYSNAHVKRYLLQLGILAIQSKYFESFSLFLTPRIFEFSNNSKKLKKCGCKNNHCNVIFNYIV